MRYQCYILCVILSLVGLSSSWAEWTTDITATAAGNSKEVTFGEHPEALDGFDSMDVPVPPLPPDGLMSLPLDAAFMVAGIFPRLATDIRQQGVDNQWELKIWSDIEDVILTWDIASIPSDRSVSLTCLDEGITADMQTESSLRLPSGLHTLTLEATVTDPVPGDEPIKEDANAHRLVCSDDIRLFLQFLMMLEQMESPAYHKRAEGTNRNDNNGRIRHRKLYRRPVKP